MKRLLLVLALLCIPAAASAQCNGVFPNNTVCGNATGSSNTPRPTSNSILTGVPGGVDNQTQYNKNGVFGGVSVAVYPDRYGALCNGTGDDGPAIQAAIDSTGAEAVRVVLSASCVYRVVTGITINKRRVVIEGSGRFVSTISYEPGAAGTLFTIGDGITQLYGVQLRNFSIVRDRKSVV